MLTLDSISFWPEVHPAPNQGRRRYLVSVTPHSNVSRRKLSSSLISKVGKPAVEAQSQARILGLTTSGEVDFASLMSR